MPTFIQIKDSSKEKNIDQVIFGIDLGTSQCVVSWYQNGEFNFVLDENGSRTIPSLLIFDTDANLIISQENKNSENSTSIISTKRLLSLTQDEYNQLKDKLPYSTSFESELGVVIHLGQQRILPSSCAQFLLTYLKNLTISTKKFQQEKLRCVITVPAWFNELQRRLIRHAAILSDWEVLGLISEPTAAALSYFHNNPKDGVYLIIDCGGGTTDISVVRQSNTTSLVVYSKGNNQLGGDDIDSCLYNYIHNSKNPTQNIDHVTLLEIKKIKEQFTPLTKIEVTSREDGSKIKIDFPLFSQIVRPFIDSFTELLNQVIDELHELEINPDVVILTGGTCQSPIIEPIIRGKFPILEIFNHNPLTAVSQGATLHGNYLLGTGQVRSKLIDTLPFSVGVETYGGVMEKIIPRLTVLPAKCTRDFTTWSDNQSGMVFTLYQGEQEQVTLNRCLGAFTLSKLTKTFAGLIRVRFELQIDSDGIITAKATEHNKANSVAYDVQVDRSISQTEQVSNDCEFVQITNARLNAYRILHHIKQLSELRPLPSEIKLQVQSLNSSLQNSNFETLLASISKLEEISKNYVSDVLSDTLHNTMVGKQINNISNKYNE